MKMKSKFRIITWLFFIPVIAAVSSCNKDDDDRVKTKTELITSGSWKLTAYTSDPAYDWYGSGVYATDILAALNPCEADGFDTYKINGILEINEGSLKCDPMNPQIFTASWAFRDNETKIIYDGIDEYILVELTETTMRLRSTFVENGVTYTHYETFGH